MPDAPVPNEKINTLDWLDNVSPEIQDEIRSCFVRRSLDADTHLYSKTDKSGKICQIVSGQVRLFFIDHNGREILIKICQKGEWVGAVAGIDHRPYPVHAETRGATTLNILTANQLDGLRAKYSELETALLIYMCGNLRNIFKLFQESVMLPVSNRIAARICSLVEDERRHKKQGESSLILSQEDLGLMTGASRQAVNKGISQLRENGLISTSYGKIAILDADGLREFADEY